MTGAGEIDIAYLRKWIGRTETVADIVTPRLVAGLRATLDESPGSSEAGAAAPLGLHWCLAPEIAPISELGPDGHAALGDFLPPVPLSHRMWAGGRVDFAAPLKVGDRVTRRSVIDDVQAKEGRSGPLCFVTVRHEYETEAAPRLSERQDIVYRNAASGGSRPAPRADQTPRWQETASAGPVRLFRYSALTFNGHRIHYDRPYCEAEGYPGLLVHGPWQATLLLQMAERIHGTAPAIFDYRAVSPLYDGADFTLNAAESADGLKLWVADAEGRTTLRAEAIWK